MYIVNVYIVIGNIFVFDCIWIFGIIYICNIMMIYKWFLCVCVCFVKENKDDLVAFFFVKYLDFFI